MGLFCVAALGAGGGVLVGGVWVWARLRARARPSDVWLEFAMVFYTAPWIGMLFLPVGHTRALQLVPFRDLAAVVGGGAVIVQVVGNLLVFAGFGALAPIRFAIRGTWRTLGVIGVLAAAGSAVVETMQYVLAIGRVSSIDDVILNALGAVLAACCTIHWWRGRRGES